MKSLIVILFALTLTSRPSLASEKCSALLEKTKTLFSHINESNKKEKSVAFVPSLTLFVDSFHAACGSLPSDFALEIANTLMKPTSELKNCEDFKKELEGLKEWETLFGFEQGLKAQYMAIFTSTYTDACQAITPEFAEKLMLSLFPKRDR